MALADGTNANRWPGMLRQMVLIGEQAELWMTCRQGRGHYEQEDNAWKASRNC